MRRWSRPSFLAVCARKRVGPEKSSGIDTPVSTGARDIPELTAAFVPAADPLVLRLAVPAVVPAVRVAAVTVFGGVLVRPGDEIRRPVGQHLTQAQRAVLAALFPARGVGGAGVTAGGGEEDDEGQHAEWAKGRHRCIVDEPGEERAGAPTAPSNGPSARAAAAPSRVALP